jgi:hypothetical protein
VKKESRVFFSYVPRKWAKYFTEGNICANHPKLLKLLQFCFVFAAHNGYIEFFLLCGPVDIKRRTWSADFIKGICIVQYNFKKSCEKFCTCVCGILDLTGIGFPEK